MFVADHSIDIDDEFWQLSSQTGENKWASYQILRKIPSIQCYWDPNAFQKDGFLSFF